MGCGSTGGSWTPPRRAPKRPPRGTGAPRGAPGAPGGEPEQGDPYADGLEPLVYGDDLDLEDEVLPREGMVEVHGDGVLADRDQDPVHLLAVLQVELDRQAHRELPRRHLRPREFQHHLLVALPV